MVEVPLGVPHPLPLGYPILPCKVLSVSGLQSAGILTSLAVPSRSQRLSWSRIRYLAEDFRRHRPEG